MRDIETGKGDKCHRRQSVSGRRRGRGHIEMNSVGQTGNRLLHRG